MRFRIWPRAHGHDRQITAWIDEASRGEAALLSTAEHSHDNGRTWHAGGTLMDLLYCEAGHRPCTVPPPHVCRVEGSCNGLPRGGT